MEEKEELKELLLRKRVEEEQLREELSLEREMSRRKQQETDNMKKDAEKMKNDAKKVKNDILESFTDILESELKCSICNELFIEVMLHIFLSKYFIKLMFHVLKG